MRTPMDWIGWGLVAFAAAAIGFVVALGVTGYWEVGLVPGIPLGLLGSALTTVGVVAQGVQVGIRSATQGQSHGR